MKFLVRVDRQLRVKYAYRSEGISTSKLVSIGDNIIYFAFFNLLTTTLLVFATKSQNQRANICFKQQLQLVFNPARTKPRDSQYSIEKTEDFMSCADSRPPFPFAIDTCL